MSSLIPKVIADLELQIASAIGIGDTSFTLNASIDDDGVAIPAGIYCFTLDNGTSNKEYLIGQVNGTAVTSVKSVSRQGAETTGALKKHRIGAPIILTDFAAIQRVVDILKGVNTLDGANPIAYGSEPTLTERTELATVGYVLDAAFGGAITFDSQVITNVNAGESVVLGDLLYLNTTDQEWYKVDADTTATVVGVQLGISKGTGSDGVAITGGVQLSGMFTTSGLTAGSLYYASNTAGGYTTTAGTIKQVVGVALSTTRLLLILPNPQTVSSREKDALAGGGDFGTPSSTNKFVTEDWVETKQPQVVTFTSSGTWTKDTGLKYIIVEGVGGGAGGDGYDTDGTSGPGASGGAGGYFRKLIVASSLGATETVTVGAGGSAGQSNASPTLGTNGGNTSFGSHATANGGGRPAGGTATSGDLNITGQSGAAIGGESNFKRMAIGGSSMFGFGGIGSVDNSTMQDGRPGVGYGAGGAGAFDSNGDDAGAGTPGIVIVTEFYS
jgi:hypothetical protein